MWVVVTFLSFLVILECIAIYTEVGGSSELQIFKTKILGYY